MMSHVGRRRADLRNFRENRTAILRSDALRERGKPGRKQPEEQPALLMSPQEISHPASGAASAGRLRGELRQAEIINLIREGGEARRKQ